MNQTPTAPSSSLLATLDEAVGRLMAASATVLRLIPEWDRRKLWEADGATCMTGWLAGRYGLARGTAREWVRAARALEALPRIAQAYEAGRLSWDQLRPLTRFATGETDEMWAARAPRMRPAALVREARRHERARRERHEDAHRARYLSLWWDPERPVLYVEGALGAEQGAALETALGARSERVTVADEPDDPAAARMADALIELTTEEHGSESSSPVVVVHSQVEVLTDERSSDERFLAETDGGQSLSGEAVRRLACDSRVEWVLERRGVPVGVGRRGRVVPAHLGRILRHRDGGCRFPGCERRRFVQAHHLIHWGRGGRTDLENLVLLCWSHHRLIHEGGWKTSGHPARDLRFHDPGGRAVGRHPPDAEGMRETVLRTV